MADGVFDYSTPSGHIGDHLRFVVIVHIDIEQSADFVLFLITFLCSGPIFFPISFSNSPLVFKPIYGLFQIAVFPYQER